MILDLKDLKDGPVPASDTLLAALVSPLKCLGEVCYSAISCTPLQFFI